MKFLHYCHNKIEHFNWLLFDIIMLIKLFLQPSDKVDLLKQEKKELIFIMFIKTKK